jgi:hypothetical protein
MNGGLGGLEMEGENGWRDQNDNLEPGTASDTVKDEVNADFYCCLRLSTTR